MRIDMHCSGGPDIGVGHVMRSVALAEAALDRGHEICFVGDFEGQFLGYVA